MPGPTSLPGSRSAGARALVLALVILLVGAACADDRDGASHDGPAPDAGRPNLLLITVDTLRADRLGAYGYGAARTPHVDALARAGTLFESAHTPIPRTTPALASLFSGLHPHEHGLVEIGERLPDAVTTLAEHLSGRGWATAGISANAAASALQGLDQGFDHFLGMDALRRRHPLRPSGHPPRAGQVARARAVTQEALTWLDARAPGEPWFLWLLYMEPHFRYEPPPELAGGRATHAHWFYRATLGFEPRAATIYFDLGGHSTAARDDLSGFYDGEVAFVDSWVGRLVEAVRAREDGPRTLVVFTADHGESLGEHGYFYEHGVYAYQATLRVPLILSWPGVVPAGRRIDAPVSLLDVMPTVGSLLGAVPEAGSVSGRDLAPVLGNGAAAPGQVVFGESGSSFHPQAPRRIVGGRRSGRGPGKEAFVYVRDGRWVALRQGDGAVALHDVVDDPALARDVSAQHPERLEVLRRRLERADLLEGRWRTAVEGRFKLLRIPGWDGPTFELYDLERDPHETRDVLSEHPEVVRRLRASLEAWTREAVAGARPAQAQPADQEAETERRLRALGYLE